MYGHERGSVYRELHKKQKVVKYEGLLFIYLMKVKTIIME
jgi:hypothetical protein